MGHAERKRPPRVQGARAGARLWLSPRMNDPRLFIIFIGPFSRATGAPKRPRQREMRPVCRADGCERLRGSAKKKTTTWTDDRRRRTSTQGPLGAPDGKPLSWPKLWLACGLARAAYEFVLGARIQARGQTRGCSEPSTSTLELFNATFWRTWADNRELHFCEGVM